MFQIESKDLLDSLIKHALADTRGRKRWHITRLKMYMDLENTLSEHDVKGSRCLCISQSQALADVLGIRKAERTITKFPDVNILDLPYVAGHFDFVISDQVLEHIEGDPFLAARESVRVAKPGAWIVHTTCFINFMHMLPLDFWRFTPQALELLMKSSGAEVVKSAGWGNRAAWTYMQLGYRGEKVPEVPGNPVYDLAMRNEPKWPVVTWIIARKPGS